MQRAGKIALLICMVVLPSFAKDDLPQKVDFLDEGFLSVDELIRFEYERLAGMEGDPKIEVPKGSAVFERAFRETKTEFTNETRFIPLSVLRKFLLTKPKLTDEEKKELLGTLRMMNALLRSPEKDATTAFKKAVTSELAGILGFNNASIKLPREIRDALSSAYEETFNEEIPKEGPKAGKLLKLLKNPKFDSKRLEPKQWAGLLGNVRAQGAQERGNDFIADLKADLFEDLHPKTAAPTEVPVTNPFRFKEKSNPLIDEIQAFLNPPKITIVPPQNGVTFAPIQTLPPVDLPFLGASHGGGNSAPRSSRGTGPSGSAGGRVSIPDGIGDGGIIVDPDAIGTGIGELPPDLLKQRNRGAFSLLMKTGFQGAANQVSSCQLTVVKKTEVGDSCSYAAATARHCVVDEQNPSRKLSFLEISPFGFIDTARVEHDPNGNDFALIFFKGVCKNENEVPVVPLKKEDVRDGEGILVDTVRGVLGGRARDAVSGNSLVVMDVRTRRNGGLGIYQGDSGGGVATLTDGKLELSGVISSKPTDPALHGIGFFAAKESMDWARDRVNGDPGQRHQDDSHDRVQVALGNSARLPLGSAHVNSRKTINVDESLIRKFQ